MYFTVVKYETSDASRKKYELIAWGLFQFWQ